MDKLTIVFVLGAPGSGKGTQCEKIVEKYGWTHLSTGDLLRAEVQAGTELGEQVNEIMAAGQMVPNEVIFELLTNAMAVSGSSRFLIDGFPRTMEQLMEFQTQIKPCDGALVFTVPEEVAVERLLARGATSGRVDDNEDTIRERMNIFWSESQQVIEFLADSVNLHEVDSAAPEEEVFLEVVPFMDEMDESAANREAGGTGEGMASEPDATSAANDEEGGPGGRVASELSNAILVYVLGIPGCDQDTQCDLVRERYDWTLITPDNLLGEEIDKGTELGKQAAEILEMGQDVPPALLVDMLAQHLIATPPASRRFLLNGFPRHMEQLEMFETRVRPCDGVLILTLPEDVAMERLMASQDYDSEEAVRDLLDAFRLETQPVIDILRDQNVQVGDVDAAGDADEVFAQVSTFIEGFGVPLEQSELQQEEEGEPQQEGEKEEEQQSRSADADADAEAQNAEAQEGSTLDEGGYSEEQVRAAIRIQAARRGYEGRKKVGAMRAARRAELEVQAAAAAAASEEQTEREEEPRNTGVTGDYTDEHVQAVTRIQAARRGYRDRKRVAEMRAELRKQQQQLQQIQQLQEGETEQGQEQEQEGGIASGPEYTDDQVQAAIHIQAARRGYVARKQMDAMRQAREAELAAQMQAAEAEAAAGPELAEADAADAGAAEAGAAGEAAADAQGASGLSYEEAIVRIQAAGRGYLDRKKMKAMKAEAEAQAAMEAEAEAQAAMKAEAQAQAEAEAQAQAHAATEAKLAQHVLAIRGMLVICGPSGVGKGTLIDRLMEEHGDKFSFSISHTTRGPRPGEQNGMHYHFTDLESMQRDIDAGMFLEYADVHGNMYGTSFAAVAAVGESGRVAVLDIDVQGATKIKASRGASKARYIFVEPPSLGILEARLRGRGTETEDKVQLRLSNATAEIERSRQPGFFDARVVNDDLEAAYLRLKITIEDLMPGTFGPAELPPLPAPPSPAPPAPAPAPGPPALRAVQSPAQKPTSARVAPVAAAAPMPVRQYMDATVVPVLREALRSLNETRPDDPLKFVADFLLEARANGGRHPRVAVAGGNGKMK